MVSGCKELTFRVGAVWSDDRLEQFALELSHTPRAVERESGRTPLVIRVSVDTLKVVVAVSSVGVSGVVGSIPAEILTRWNEYKYLFTTYIIHQMKQLITDFMLHSRVHGTCYPACGMVHIKYPLLLISKCSTRSGGSGFLLIIWMVLNRVPNAI